MSQDALERALQQARARRKLPDPASRRRLRKRAGLSQSAVARVVGVSAAAVNRWELGVRQPSGERLQSYLGVLERLAREGLM